ncbi:MAG: PQQ-binding-like beta-propeller repeat protein [Candidatus Hydrogenedentes bacterium]|nr:PQQ-binding-like beta-propeller repeat protein [Candidatus Hydrogenedentota bacterium]
MVLRSGVLAGIIALLAAAEAGAVESVWSYRTAAGQMAGSPAVGDVDGDGTEDLATADTAGMVAVFRGNGELFWQRKLTAPFTIAPTLADVCPSESDAGGGVLELLVVNGAGRVFCLDANNGALIWDYALPDSVDWGNTSLSVNDLDLDGSVEIVTGDISGSVVCLSGEGDARWVYTGTHGHTLCPASGDLDGDGQGETLIAGSTTALVCLSHEGKALWQLGEGKAGASPVIWDLDGDGRSEIVAAMGKDLAVVNGDGTVRWSHAMQQDMDSAISVADTDGNGVPEIYAVDLSGLLACLAPDGSLRWSASVGQRARRSPSIGDVTGDGVMEILVAGYSAAIHVFAPDGALQEEIKLPATSNATATIMRVGSGAPDTWRTGVVCPTEDGTLQAFQWPGAPEQPIAPWPAYRMNTARTAAQPEERAPQTVQVTGFALDADTLEKNVCRVEVANPDRRALKVLLEVAVDGSPMKSVTRASSKAIIEYRLPYCIPGRDAAKIAFTCTVLEGEAIIARQQRNAFVAPFREEIARAEECLAALKTQVPQLADRSGAEERFFFLDNTIRNCRDQIASKGALTVRERGALQDTLEGTLESMNAFSAVVQAALATKSAAQGSLLLCAANPWAPFGGLQEAAEGRTPPPDLGVEAFRGEVEGAALNIFNFGNTARTLRVELDPVAPTQAAPTDTAAQVKSKDVITLHEAIEVPTLLLDDPSSDALPLLNQAMTITVPAWSGRQLWLNVNVSPLVPGDWSTRVRLRTLEAASVELIAKLGITVWKAGLPEKQPLTLCHWAYVDSSYLKDYPEEALKDQVDHGTNVFVCLSPPKAAFNEKGELTGPIDFTAHDAYVRQHPPHGIILFCGYQGSLTGPGGEDSDAYRKASIPWLRAWVKHLKELGVGYDGYALYPIDEIGLKPEFEPHYLSLARLAREADPKIQLYADVSVGPVELDWEGLIPYVDIWCPNTAGYLFERNHEDLAFMKSTGKTVWSYECYGVAKHQSPLGYYRAQSMRAWHHGLTGIGFWTYCTTADNPWYATRASNEYTMVYAGKGVVTSKRWEAVRDGIEDYSMLDTLKKAWASEGVQQKHPELAEAVNTLLGERTTALSTSADFKEWDVRPGPEGLASRRTHEDAQWQAYRNLRTEIARLLAVLAE